jgi:homocysteine S-methyltransferase
MLFEFDRVLICDGAMRTMLHSSGIPFGRTVSELNITAPALVRDLHSAYLAAGADIVQTNTFDANRLRLADAGRAANVAEVNRAGARLAREAVARAGRPGLVAGSIGPARGHALTARACRSERVAALREKVAALADLVDLLVLETFGGLAILMEAVEIAKDGADVPIVAQLTFGEDGRTLRGEDPAEAAEVVAGLGAAALGANCTVGPTVLQDVITELAMETDLPIAVQPNAGPPRRLGRVLPYANNPDYFAAAAVELVARGAGIVGGCCGTTPEHIRAVARAVAGVSPAARSRPRPRPTSPFGSATPVATGVRPAEHGSGWLDCGRPVVVAALRSPRGSDVQDYLEQAKALVAAGADMLVTTEPEPGQARVNPVSAAVLLSVRTGSRIMFQAKGAGRTAAALQANLLGAYAFGLRVVLCRTGVVPVEGDYPEAAGPTGLDSVRLTAVLAGLNDGVDWRGVPIPERTSFVIGASLDVSGADRTRVIARAVEKVRAGAHFLVTDVVYDAASALAAVQELRAAGVTVPTIASIAPFQDARAIARFAHETPEVRIPLAPVRGDERNPVATAAQLADELVASFDGLLVHGPGWADERVVTIVEALAARCRAR